MQVVDILAHEVALGDILGEGMQVWLILWSDLENKVTVQWGPTGASLMTGKYQDEAHRLEYNASDIIRVIRG